MKNRRYQPQFGDPDPRPLVTWREVLFGILFLLIGVAGMVWIALQGAEIDHNVNQFLNP